MKVEPYEIDLVEKEILKRLISEENECFILDEFLSGYGLHAMKEDPDRFRSYFLKNHDLLLLFSIRVDRKQIPEIEEIFKSGYKPRYASYLSIVVGKSASEIKSILESLGCDEGQVKQALLYASVKANLERFHKTR